MKIDQHDPNKDILEQIQYALTLSKEYCTTDHGQTGKGSVFDRAQNAMMAYEGIIDPETWQNNSEVFFRYAKKAVDLTVPVIVNWLFGMDELVKVLPAPNSASSSGDAEMVSQFLNWRIRNTLNCPTAMLPTFFSLVKLGVGYGIVDVKYVTPYGWQDVTEATGQASMRAYDPVDAIALPSYRNIPFARVLPSPSGGGGPNDREWVIWIDHIPENQLEAMIADPESPVDGDFKKIVADTRQKNLDGHAGSVLQLLDYLTSEGSHVNIASGLAQKINSRKALRVQVPIVKFYAYGRHVWLANGDTVIYDIGTDNGLSLRCPILKGNFWPDRDDWYTEGMIGANEDIFQANNIWMNTILDVLDFVSRPRFIQDVVAVPGDLDLSPWGVTKGANIQQHGLQPLPIPGLRPEMLNMLQSLLMQQEQFTGHADQMVSTAPAGMVRGGPNAFESLLSTTTIRDRFSALAVEGGFFYPFLEEVLLTEQMTIQMNQSTSYYANTGKVEKGAPVTENRMMSYDTLRQNFVFEVDFREKMRQTMADQQFKMSRAQLIAANPQLARMVGPEKLLELIMGSSFAAKRVMEGADPAAYDRLLAHLAALGMKPGPGAGSAPNPAQAGSNQ